MTEHYSHRRRKVQGDPSVGGSEAGHARRKNKGAAPIRKGRKKRGED